MGSVAVRVLVLLGVLLGLTAWQLPMWASDEALWSVAVRLNRTSPRPAFNYGLALRHAGHVDRAAFWLAMAADRATGHPREADYRRAVQAQFMAIELSGVPICASASVQPYC